MLVYEDMYLTDTSESVLKAEIEGNAGFEIKGTLSLDIGHDRAAFSGSKYNIELQDIGITVIEGENNCNVIVVISEYGVGEWVFEQIYETG